MTSTAIRPAVEEDAGTLAHIYNEAIVDGSYATADIEPVTEESRADWIGQRTHPFGVFICESPRGVPVGWCALSPLAICPRWTGVVEPAVYLTGSARGTRLGTKMIEYLLSQAEARGFTSMVAVIFERNTASVRGLFRAGFDVAVSLPDVAFIRDEWQTVLFLEKQLRGAR